jgi:hypothetical protein
MEWKVILLREFTTWLDRQPVSLREEAVARLNMLKKYGPILGRPTVDTIKGSKLPNLKEIRFDHERNPVRILFAFDFKRQAAILLGGIKGKNSRWYDEHIPLAERLFKDHESAEKKKDKEEVGKHKPTARKVKREGKRKEENR